MDPRLNDAVENAKGELREYFKTRTKEKLKSLVEEWKTEQVYPFKGEPKNPVQKVERQVFDLVAVNVATNLPDFQTQDPRNRKFQLRMLKQAIERGPEQLQIILEEVLDLSHPIARLPSPPQTPRQIRRAKIAHDSRVTSRPAPARGLRFYAALRSIPGERPLDRQARRTPQPG